MDQWNRMESLEINACLYDQLIFGQKCKIIQWRKESLFNKQYWENWTDMCKKIRLDQSLYRNKFKVDQTEI